MFRIKCVFAAALLLLLLGTAGFAQEGELTTGEVERWLESMNALEATGVADQQLAVLMASIYDARNFAGLASSAVENVPDMDQAIQSAGFADAAEWAATWMRVWPGFLYIVMSEEIAAARVRIEQQRREVQEDPDLDEESRAMMLEELDFAERSQRVPFEVADADVEAVAPYRDELEALFMGLQGRGR